MNRTLPLLLGLTTASAALGQNASAGTQTFTSPTPASGFPIVTDRPSFSDGPYIIPTGHYQIESGYTYLSVNGVRTQTFPEAILRAPLGQRLELRIVNLGFGDVSGDASGRGLLDPAIGFKLKLLDGVTGRRPDVALIAVTSVPVGSSDFRQNTLQPTLKVAWYQGLDASNGLGGNVVYSDLANGGGRYSQFSGSVYYSRTFSPAFGSFAELYGLFPSVANGPNVGYADVGVTYLLNRATQVDFRLGTGFDQGRDGSFVGAGISYRF